MPELPETTLLARQLHEELPGRTVKAVEVRQPKCLNVETEVLVAGLTGQTFRGVTVHGKWVLAELFPSAATLCLNLGMGGEILLLAPDALLPEKWAVRLDLADGHRLAIGFWWFGHVHLVAAGKTGAVSELGPSPLEMSFDQFYRVLRASPAAGVKAVMLDQRRMAGIGNVYVQDPLWMARIHPMRKTKTLTDDEIRTLYEAMRERLQLAIANSGSRFELDIYGRRGNWGRDNYLVAYRPGEPCPRCGTPVSKIKSGATSTFICPECQKL